MENTPLSVSDCIALVNQTLEYAYPTVLVEGEVVSFKVNKNQYVFFDLKDDSGTLNCFMTVYQLRVALEDGMRVRVIATPRLTQWGRFSLTVREVVPVGEGSLKRAFDLLRAKLEREGLTAAERKRPLPVMPHRIGVVSSTQAAGYADFTKIIQQRWGGVELVVANVQVQGMAAPGQIVRALEHLNQLAEPVDVIAVLRGGGSADDLAAFNDEPLARAIASSRAPVIVGVGHETDTSLADLVADVRAATPSNAAQLLVPDRRDIEQRVQSSVRQMLLHTERQLTQQQRQVDTSVQHMLATIERSLHRSQARYNELRAVLHQLDPRAALARGYALVRDTHGRILGSSPPEIGATVTIETERHHITTGVTHVNKKA